MWRIFEDPHKLELPKPEDALPGRANAMPVSSRHFVSGAPLARPFSRGPGSKRCSRWGAFGARPQPSHRTMMGAEMPDAARGDSDVERRLQAVLDVTSGLTGQDFFASLVRHLAAALEVRFAFVAQCTDETRTSVRTLAFWSGDDLRENFRYAVAGTPCERVMKNEVCFYSRDLASRFPSDHDLQTLGVQAYLGIPVLGLSGDVVGHLVVMDVNRMERPRYGDWILKLFAMRAGAEIDRRQAERVHTGTPNVSKRSKKSIGRSSRLNRPPRSRLPRCDTSRISSPASGPVWPSSIQRPARASSTPLKPKAKAWGQERALLPRASAHSTSSGRGRSRSSRTPADSPRAR